jgi:AbrB family looped-hinge helix DNA binding protein
MRRSTKLTTKGQVVIPKSIRDQLRWRPGTPLAIETTPEGAVLLRPLSRDGRSFERVIEEACGFLREGDPVSDLEAQHRLECGADEPRRL